jgi:hypothetical protein
MPSAIAIVRAAFACGTATRIAAGAAIVAGARCPCSKHRDTAGRQAERNAYACAGQRKQRRHADADAERQRAEASNFT